MSPLLNSNSAADIADDSFTLIFCVLVYLILVAGTIASANSADNTDGNAHSSESNHQPTEDRDTDVKENTHVDSIASDDEQNATDGENKRSMSNYQWRIVRLTSLIAAVTAIYAGFAILQWNAMLASNQTNQESLLAVQRAFVFLPEFTVNPAIDIATKKPGLLFMGRWENSGNTPATKVRNYINSDWRTELLPKGFNYPDNPPLQVFPIAASAAPMLIGPRASFNTSPMFIFKEQLDEVNAGKTHVHFWGWASYIDAFNCPHHTEFCQEVGSVQGNVVFMFACPEHNCADQDCEDYRASGNPQCMP
jgi:hypothetical protein